MVINKRGQAAGYAVAFMLAVCLVLMAVYFATPINQLTTAAMNETSEIGGMACDNVTTSDFVKAACITTDIGQSYFIGGLLAIAGIIIAMRIIFS